MDPVNVDIKDTRGRLIRLAASLGLAAVITVLALIGMRSVSGDPNADPIGGSVMGFVGLLVFVLTSVAIAGVISVVRGRLARRAARR
jgi:hypothetical protein